MTDTQRWAALKAYLGLGTSRRAGVRRLRLFWSALDLLELESRAELRHVLDCDDCVIFDSYDGGAPQYCRAFQVKFRGLVIWVDEAAAVPSLIPHLWAGDLMRQLNLKPTPWQEEVLAKVLTTKGEI